MVKLEFSKLKKVIFAVLYFQLSGHLIKLNSFF